MTYLYIKEHETTGLRYFGKTIADPYKYPGSGLYWKYHLNQHGKNVKTLWAEKFDDAELCQEFAEFFSEFFDIVNSDTWANLIPENAQGGGSRKGRSVPWLKGTKRPEHAKIMSAKMSGEGNPRFGKSPWNKGLTGTQTGPNPKKALPGDKNGMFGKQQSEEAKQKMRAAWARRKEQKELLNA